MVFLVDRLPPEIQYAMDNIVELCDVTADVATFFRHHDEKARVFYDFTAEECDFHGIPFDHALPRLLDQRYMQWRKTAPLHDRIDCLLSGAGCLTMQIDELAHGISDHGIDKLLQGGKRSQRRARSPDAVIRAGATERSRNFAVAIERLRGLIADDVAEAAGQEDHVLDLLATERQLTMQAERQLAEEVRRVFERRVKRPPRSVRKQKAKAMLRAFNFASSLIGRETVSAFVQGDRITIAGRNMDFIIKPKGLCDGYGGWFIEVADKTGVVMCELCVYQEDVNTLDQVAALAMHVMAGDEEKVFAIGNLHQTHTPNHPLIIQRSELRDEIKPPQQHVPWDMNDVRLQIDGPAGWNPSDRTMMRREVRHRIQRRYRSISYSMDDFVPDDIVEARNRVRAGREQRERVIAHAS